MSGTEKADTYVQTCQGREKSVLGSIVCAWSSVSTACWLDFTVGCRGSRWEGRKGFVRTMRLLANEEFRLERGAFKRCFCGFPVEHVRVNDQRAIGGRSTTLEGGECGSQDKLSLSPLALVPSPCWLSALPSGRLSMVPTSGAKPVLYAEYS